MSMGCITYYRKPIAENFADSNFYTMLENEYEKFKIEDQIGLAPGVLRLRKSKKDPITGTYPECNPEGTPNQLIQSNITFEPTRMEYTHGDPECTEVERVWPGQLY